MFETKIRDGLGRIGRLITNHGALETPFLFPVVDPVKQTPSLEIIESIGFNGFITNAYLFYKRNRGIPRPIHDAFSWSKVIMTDSGGYQILEYGEIDVDNKTIVQYEIKIDSDIAVILDIPTGSRMTYNDAYVAIMETYRRGIEVLPLTTNSKQLWVYPVQGAPYRDLLVHSAVLGRRLPYDVYAVGSPTVILEKYRYSEIVELVILARAHLPPEKPIHVFGVGHPMIISFLVAAGGDLFDSASYILYARDGRYMLETGTRDIRELSYFPCNCSICSKYTPRELLELPSEEKINALATHNLYTLIKEINTVKQAIREGRLWELLEYRSMAHPSLRGALRAIARYRKLIEKYTPMSNPGGRAILVFNAESLKNPRLRLNIRKATKYSLRDLGGKVVILIPAYGKPYRDQGEYSRLVDLIKGSRDYKILFIHPLLGIFTPGLSSTYPFYQHECRLTREDVRVSRIVKWIKMILEKEARDVVILKTSWFTDDVVVDTLRRLGDLARFVKIYTLNEISSRLLQ